MDAVLAASLFDVGSWYSLLLIGSIYLLGVDLDGNGAYAFCASSTYKP